MYSSILILQIGHFSKFLLHLMHAALCLQGIYNVSLSFSQQIMHSYFSLIFYKLFYFCEQCIFTLKVETDPILKQSPSYIKNS